VCTVPGKIKTYIFAVILQLCQILTITDFNNFCSAKTGKNVQTKRAFTYLLLKEGVANDVINVSLFA